MVSDTGVGMTEEETLLALEPFRQVDGTSTCEQDGTGLGLPLSRSFAELHGGSLAIDSKPGHGTTVRVDLPASRQQAGLIAA